MGVYNSAQLIVMVSNDFTFCKVVFTLKNSLNFRDNLAFYIFMY